MEPFKVSTDFWNQVSPGDAASSFVVCKDPSPSKPPPPPELPRSAFMCFSAYQNEVLQQKENSSIESKDSLQLIASEWNKLTENEKNKWQDVSRNDRIRYAREKSEYKGHKVELKSRSKKHPLAPKRPMSAFLKYSKLHRSSVQAMNPTLLNSDISRILGEMWRTASEEVKATFIMEAERECEIYKRDIAKFHLQMKSEKSNVLDCLKHTGMPKSQIAALDRWDCTPVRPQVFHPNPEHRFVERGSYDSTRMISYGGRYPKSHIPISKSHNSMVFTDITPPDYYMNAIARRYQHERDDPRKTQPLEDFRTPTYFYHDDY